MKSSLLKSVLAVLLTTSLVTPAAFFVAPQRAQAQWLVTDIPALAAKLGAWANQAIGVIQQTLTQVNTWVTRVAAVAKWINENVLQPIALIMALKATKSLTAGVLAFTIGKSNGTGAPQFVGNLQGTLQKVGDTQKTAFLAQFGSQSNSPFAASITSSLRTNYLQNTSMAGFWAASRNTLPQFTGNNPNAFLNGNWSQGGVGAWLALTTQTQNNPFTFHQEAQAKMASVIGSAEETRKAVLSWGQGMMSWCGTADGKAGGEACESSSQCMSGYSCVGDEGSTGMGTCKSDAGPGETANGVKPGDTCTNKDGTPGTIQTPGSTIKTTLDKVLGANQDRLTQVGNMASNVGSIISGIGTIMNTVQFAQQILGGQGSGGLAGIGNSSGSGSPSVLAQYNNSTATNAAVAAAVNQNVAGSPLGTGSGSGAADRIAKFKTAWDTITTMVNAAATNVTDLKNFCTAAATADPSFSAASQQAAAAQSALDNVIAPILIRATKATSDIAAANALLAKIDCELNAPAGIPVYCPADSPTAITDPAASYAADIQTLQTMPPTDSDVVHIQQETQTGPTKPTAAPEGSLNISGGSILDQMVLININAAALKSVCIPSSPDTGGGGI